MGMSGGSFGRTAALLTHIIYTPAEVTLRLFHCNDDARIDPRAENCVHAAVYALFACFLTFSPHCFTFV